MLIVFLDQTLVHDVLMYQEFFGSHVITKFSALFKVHVSTFKRSIVHKSFTCYFINHSSPCITISDIIIMIL